MPHDDENSFRPRQPLRLYHLGWIAFALIVLAGVIGFERSVVPAPPLIDRLYYTFQLFALSFPSEPGWISFDPTWELQAARFAAPAYLLSALIAAVTRTTLHGLSLAYQTRIAMHRRYVFLGFGETNRAIAAEAIARGRVVTIVDRDFDDATEALGRGFTVVLLAGNLNLRSTMLRVRIGQAQRVFVASGNTARNIEIGILAEDVVEQAMARRWPEITSPSWWRRLLRGEPSGPVEPRRHGHTPSGDAVVCVHVPEPLTNADLNEVAGSSQAPWSGLRTFSLPVEGARLALSEVDPIQSARDQGHDRAHLALIGLSNEGMAFLLEFLCQGHAADMKPPQITLIAPNASAALAEIAAARPRLFDGSLPEFVQPILEAADLGPTALDFTEQLSLECARPPITTWVTAIPESEENLRVANRLLLSFAAGARPPTLLLHLQRSGSGFAASAQSRIAGLAASFGQIAPAIRRSELLEEEIDELARKLHASYQHSLGTSGETPAARNKSRFTGGWNSLPENGREANRRTVRSLPKILTELGVSWKRGSGAGLPHIPAPLHSLLCHAADPDSGRGEMRERWISAASSEHMRWIAERAMAGWRPGPPDPKNEFRPMRDNARKLHDKMVQLEDLSKLSGLEETLMSALDLLARQPQRKDVATAVIERRERRSAGPTFAPLERGITTLELVLPSENPASAGLQPDSVDLVLEWARRPEAAQLELVVPSSWGLDTGGRGHEAGLQMTLWGETFFRRLSAAGVALRVVRMSSTTRTNISSDEERPASVSS